MTQKVSSFIEQLAAQLGVAANELLSIYTAQAKVSIITRLISILPTVALAIGLAAILYRLWPARKNAEDPGDFIIFFAVCAVLYLLVIYFIYVILSEVGEIITCVLNPEYWALNEIITQITTS